MKPKHTHVVAGVSPGLGQLLARRAAFAGIRCFAAYLARRIIGKGNER